jgi:hypothetical protein
MAVLVKITNWEKWNPKRDVKNPLWFKFQNMFFVSHDVYELLPTQKLVFIYLLCERSRRNEEWILVNTELAAQHLKCTETDVLEAIKVLQVSEMIETSATKKISRRKPTLSRELELPEKTLSRDLELPDKKIALEEKREEENRQEENRQEETRENKDVELRIRTRELFDLWNSHCGDLSKAARLTETRADKIRTRLKEEPDLSYWEKAIRNLAASEFCRKSGWCSFDWLIENDTNHVKAFEDKFRDQKRETAPQGVPQSRNGGLDYLRSMGMFDDEPGESA